MNGKLSKDRNKSLRRLMWNKGVRHKDVAAELGMLPNSFSRLLRQDLPDWKVDEITQVIERLGK